MRRTQSGKILSVIIILTIAVACIAYYWISNAPKRALEKQIIAMQGMPVNLDFKNSTSIFEGRDSIYIPLPSKKHILFVDSTSCSSCFIGKLIEYFDINDTLKSKSVQLIVILQPKDIRYDDVIKRLHNDRYPFWCIVDSRGEFIKNNPRIPDNQLLHSFTIDGDNKIILVGDPKRNEKIRNLLLKIVDDSVFASKS